MSILGKIMGAIFGEKASAAPASGRGGHQRRIGPRFDVRPCIVIRARRAGANRRSRPLFSTRRRLQKKAKKLEWRTSIVDLMKALDIDSSLTARKELAKELGYTGDTNDSASMNIWLHKQVMTKLAANGGKLPPDIKH